ALPGAAVELLPGAPPLPNPAPPPPPPPIPVVTRPAPPPPPPPPPQIPPLFARLSAICARNAGPPTLPDVADTVKEKPPLPPVPPAPIMVPLLVICSVLPLGKAPVSKAGTLGDVDPMTTPLAMVAFTAAGVPAVAKPCDTR